MRAITGRYWAAMLVGIVAMNLAWSLHAQDAGPAEEAAPAAAAEAAEEKHEEPTADAHPAPEKAGNDHAAAGHSEAGHGNAGHGGEGHGDGGHHDPYDLTHGNMTENATNPAEFKSDLALFTAVVFLLLMAILAKFAWGPIGKALDQRERVVADNIAEAKRLHAEAEAKLKGYEQQIANAQDEVRELIERGKRESEAIGQKIVADAEATANRERQRSVAEIQAAKNQALGELAQKSVDTAVGLAGQIVRRSLNPEDHAQLIQEAVDQFPSRN